MKTPRILATTIAALLAGTSAHSATFLWDGGDVTVNSIFASANWNPNGAPPSDLVNTDLVFDGVVRTSPSISSVFSADSVTFNNNAAANPFTFSGVALTIGTTGIVNNDANTQTFTNQVVIGTATSTFNAASGGLTFTNSVSLGTNALNLIGTGAYSFATFGGSGTVTKSGAGTMTWSPTGTQSLGLVIDAGTVNTVADATVDTFDSLASIDVNGTSAFNINESLVLSGAPLTRATGATINLSAGKTLTVQNSADVSITGAFTNSTASTIAVTGAGSTFTTTGATQFQGGSTLNVTAGGSVSAGSFLDLAAVTGGGNATVLVDGAGSSIASSAGGHSFFGLFGNTALVTFSNGGAGNFAGGIQLAPSGAGTVSTVNVQSGSTLTVGNLQLGNTVAAASATLTVTGGGSTVARVGSPSTTIGSSTGSVAVLNVLSGGVFDSGTGLMTVNATGTVNLDSGTVNLNGNVLVDGGQLNRNNGGFYVLAPGKNLTVQSGGDLNFGGADLVAQGSSTITLTGAGTTYTGSFLSTFGAASTVNINSGAVAAISGNGGLQAQAGSVTVDGAGSQLTSNGTANGFVGSSGNSATLAFTNNASGSFNNTLSVPNTNATNGSGTLSVQSGADLTVSNLAIASTGTNSTGSVTVTGAGSTLTQLFGGINVGKSSSGSGSLTVSSRGVVNAASTAVSATGSIAVTGGTFNVTNNATLIGGQLTRDGAGTLSLALGASLSAINGGDVIVTGAIQQLQRSNLTVSGTGSTFTTTGDFQWEGGSSTLSFVQVSSGGLLSTGGSLHLGRNNTAVSLSVSGATSQIVASPFFTSEWQAGVLLTNGASATLGALKLADVDFFSTSFGSLDVQSGSTVSVGNISAASGTAQETATITVAGTGSAIAQTGASTLTLGAALLSSATLTVNNGGTFTSGTGFVTLNATGAVNINGGTVTLKGPLNRNGGNVNFTSGALNIVSNWNVGTGGLLGANVSFDATRRMTTTATTTVDTLQTLTLNGGSLSTGALVNNGSIAFNSGTLAITGAGGFEVGTGALGANIALGTGANLSVTNTATIGGAATLRLAGGTFVSNTLDNLGTLRIDTGTATAATIFNEGGGRIFVSDTLRNATTFVNLANARLTLEGGTGFLAGSGIDNSGLVTGDGTLFAVLNNLAGGEVRGESGKTLYFTSFANINAGRLNLLGGTLNFANLITNSSNGQINGHGALYFPSSPAPTSASPNAGLMNAGQMNLSGGDSQIFGTVQMQAGSKLIVSGGATASFYDIFRHSGSEVRASAGSALSFFAEVRGGGPFTGSGTVYFEGGYSPGSSPALVRLDTGVSLGDGNTLTMELGGTEPGTGYDQLALGGDIDFNGTLLVDLIDGFIPADGQVFDLFDFDPTHASGSFDSITFADALPAGLAFDTSEVTTTGKITVVPEPVTPVLILAGFALAARRRRK